MAGEAALSHEELLRQLQILAKRAVKRYGLPEDVTIKLINVSENATYCVEHAAGRQKWALRVHREGYHSRTAIASELAWLAALRHDGAVATPTPLKGLDGEFIQTVAVDGLASPRNVVLFLWESGAEPVRDRHRGLRNAWRDGGPHARARSPLATAVLVRAPHLGFRDQPRRPAALGFLAQWHGHDAGSDRRRLRKRSR